MFKTIDSIDFFLNENSHITTNKNININNNNISISNQLGKDNEVLLNRFDKVERHLGNNIFRYFFNNDSFILDLNFKGECLITLDMREIYDFDDEGRIYNIYLKKGCLIIEYSKYLSNVLETLAYKRYLVIKTNIELNDNNYKKINQWKEVYYKEDEERKSFPWRLYVYDALKFNLNKKIRLAFSYSDNLDSAIEKVKKNFIKPYEEKTALIKLNNTKLTLDKSFAYLCVVKSLNDLYVEFQNENVFGFFAGLPWFFQFWARDELIAIKSLKFIDKIDLAKKILINRLGLIDQSGRLQNRFPSSELGSADSTGWLYNRIYEYLEFFSQKELSSIREILEKTIISMKNSMQDYLIRNNANETWMDTSFNGDVRDGFRIEIQALWLSILRLVNAIDRLLLKEEIYHDFEEIVKENVKNKFFNGYCLKDGLDDETIRPNIFLACYVYPELLSKEEWEKVFDYCIDKLWLSWGGFSTIDKNSSLFCPYYTGEDNKSYHRGDSWFFINNIAAICMIRINKEKYKEYIDKIIDASTEDILYNGAIARPSELSSANEQKAQASLFQLWSASTFIELMNLYS